jgi:pimeloyl-ACP methyl ester carboxylesterase
MERATIAAVEVENVAVSDTSVRVRRWGEGDGLPILYWHGGGGGSTESPVLGPCLAAAGYTMHAVDAPGYGGSPPLDRERYLASTLAELAAELVEKLGLAPTVWVGFSWGGNIGLHTAALFPATVRALCLLDSGYLQATDDPDYDPETSYETERADLQRRLDEGESWDAPAEVIAAAMEGSWKDPCPPLYDRLRALDIPVLLAHATKPPEAQATRAAPLARFRAAVPSARIVPIPGATHGVLAEKPVEVCRLVADWLSELT